MPATTLPVNLSMNTLPLPGSFLCQIGIFPYYRKTCRMNRAIIVLSVLTKTADIRITTGMSKVREPWGKH